MKRVRVFIDNSNLTIEWSKNILTSGSGVRWIDLPTVIMDSLASHGFVGSGSDLRGVTVYASIKQKGEETHEKFLHNELDQLPGYTVRLSLRKERPCSHDKSVIHHVEKGVDTKIVCDMLALAMRDHYDLSVIISDDEDLVPSVQCVQDILDRQIIHVGFRGSGLEMRSAAWGHMILDDMLDALKGDLRPGDNCSPRQRESCKDGRPKRRRRRARKKPAAVPSADTVMQAAMKIAVDRAAS